jgi:serine/threonine protein kinase
MVEFNTEQSAYQRLRKIYAERTRDIVLWVGSGLSQPAKLPGWQGLRSSLVAEGRKKADSLNQKDGRILNQAISSVEHISDLWQSFDRLKQLLGQTSYQAAIRDALTPKPNVTCPELYLLFWQLRIGGMLTLNLDRFAAKSYAEHHKTAALNEVTGSEAPRRPNILKSSAPFIVNLHGIAEDAMTWVLTKSDLNNLLSQEAYKTFIHTIFLTKTVLFVGVSADDVATGGLLVKLRAAGIDPGQHFWLTNRNDTITDMWAENAGIEVIRYQVISDHTQALSSFFDDMKQFVPVDPPEQVPVLISPIQPASYLPLPKELMGEDPETVRMILTAYAKSILSSEGDTQKKYNDFTATYQRVIHNAWYVTEAAPENVLFGHTIKDLIGTGAFANVYRATSPKGEEVAIKLLRAEVGQNEQMLGSFRRGVRSMKILNDRAIPGMVPYLEAYELPACAVMEFIEGPNLQDAVEATLLHPWQESLRILLDVARIVRAGHRLPEQVLHRDIRPQNIMLKNYYVKGSSGWEVVVLDFDLSWHRGATEKSIDLKAATALGYLAPEQVQHLTGISTRSAAVDAFGLGMTMAYTFTGKHPQPGASANANWENKIKNDLLHLEHTEWSSLPVRLARLIVRSTKIEQNQRMDFGEIEAELERLHQAWLFPKEVAIPELWAEEILTQCFGPDGYKWNNDTFEGVAYFSGGLRTTLRADEVKQKILLHTDWAFSGEHERRNIGKFLPTKVDQFTSRLRMGGWSITEKSVETVGGIFNVSAEVNLAILKRDKRKIVEALMSGAEVIKF